MPGWQDRLRGRFRGSKATPETVFSGLRSMALSIELSDLDLPPSEPWSGALVAMMEIGLKNGIASFVAIADGSVSMYTRPKALATRTMIPVTSDTPIASSPYATRNEIGLG